MYNKANAVTDRLTYIQFPFLTLASCTGSDMVARAGGSKYLFLHAVIRKPLSFVSYRHQIHIIPWEDGHPFAAAVYVTTATSPSLTGKNLENRIPTSRPIMVIEFRPSTFLSCAVFFISHAAHPNVFGKVLSIVLYGYFISIANSLALFAIACHNWCKHLTPTSGPVTCVHLIPWATIRSGRSNQLVFISSPYEHTWHC